MSYAKLSNRAIVAEDLLTNHVPQQVKFDHFLLEFSHGMATSKTIPISSKPRSMEKTLSE